MKTLITIDPGKCTGYAIFDDSTKTLLAAGACSPHDPPTPYFAPVRVLIEKPVVYPYGKGRGDPNDLITLALYAGEITGFYRRFCDDIKFLKPRQWKGTVPKEVHHPKILASLTHEERAKLPDLAVSVQHNMIDAIGMGLWALGRI